jgi:hypothetical protein
MQSDFTGMLRDIKGRFKDPEAPCEAVQALASLQQGLEETKEYRAAQAEKELSDKGNRVLLLKKQVEESKAAAENLLGYPLKTEYLSKGQAYELMPMGFVDRLIFDSTIQHYQNQIATMKEVLDRCKGELAVLKAPNFKPHGYGCNTQQQQIEQTERSIHSGVHQLREARSKLLGYVMEHQPMLDATFSDKLAAHLDAMLDAYLELRQFHMIV